jgi:hypothetical protein
MITTHIATTSGIEAIIDDVDDVHDKFPSGLTIGDGQSVVLNTLLEAKAPTREKPIGYGMHKKTNLELRCWSTNPSKVFFPDMFNVFILTYVLHFINNFLFSFQL